MSVKDFQQEMSKRQTTNLAIVSGQLLIDLRAAGLLTSHTIQMNVPTCPKFGATVADWLKSMGVNPNAPLSVVKEKYSGTNTYVEEDVLHGLSMNPSGPSSFKLLP